MPKHLSSLAHGEFYVVSPTHVRKTECKDRQRRFWSSDNFFKGVESYWVPYEALNEVDKKMKVILVYFFEDMIPCKEVTKASSAKGRKEVFGKLFSFFFFVGMWTCSVFIHLSSFPL